MKARETLKFLLLQIRDDLSVRQEETASFLKHGRLGENQIEVHNVFDNPKFGAEILSGYDGLIVGGASEASVLEPEKYPFVHSSVDLMRHCIEVGFPVFASCFGFQLAVIALNGEIIKKEKDFEMGTLPISQTQLAKSDPIFEGVADPFYAVSVHQESAHQLPENCLELANTDFCVHAFRYQDRPFWAFQFHPELDKETLRERLGVYQDKYTDNGNHYQEVIASLKDTDDSQILLRNFINYLSQS